MYHRALLINHYTTNNNNNNSVDTTYTSTTLRAYVALPFVHESYRFLLAVLSILGPFISEYSTNANNANC